MSYLLKICDGVKRSNVLIGNKPTTPFTTNINNIVTGAINHG